jgi:dTDP-4-amino-4,6-dideoxygalactose transaminase
MIQVTRPFLPPQDEYDQYLKGIWQRNWLTNNGPLVNDLELKLKEFLNLEHLLFVTNGTIAIQMAMKALGLTGNVITTPFSYVATTSSIVWEGCTPRFVDIDPDSCNIDPAKIESAIDQHTTGILATHVYGNPCDVEAINAIAKKHGLKVIYDGAHAFNVKIGDKSIFEFGDISTSSFHATKLFHTIEGGCVVTKSADILKQLSYLRNFGHDGPEKFAMVGVNGKNSEFHAAMGLVNLNYVEANIAIRKRLTERYLHWLDKPRLTFPRISPNVTYNFAYFACIFESEETALKVQDTLNKHWIYPRRYFYPSLNLLPYVSGPPCPVSENISGRVLCLPMYDTLTIEDVDMICRLILRTLRY